MQVLSAKKQEENCTGRYSKGLRNQNENDLVNLCESNNFETQVIGTPSLNNYNGELARTLIPAESTNNRKI